MHDTGGVGGAGAVSPKSVPGGRCGWVGLAWALGMAPQPSQASQLTASLPLAPGRSPGPAAPIGVGLLLFLLPDSSQKAEADSSIWTPSSLTSGVSWSLPVT